MTKSHRECNTSVSDGYKHGRDTVPGRATSNNECQQLLFHCNARDIFTQITPCFTHEPEAKKHVKKT